MKNIFKIVVAFLLVISFIQFASPVAEASSFREVKIVNSSSGVSVYEKASKSSNYVGQLKVGTFVTQFSTTNGWAYVTSPTHKGYVDAKFITTPTHAIKIASSKSGLVVKASPTRNSATVATLKQNMIVKDYGAVGGGWSFVQYGNVTGYVASTFIGNASTKTAYVNSASGAVARNIASPSGASVGTIAHGTKVTVYTTLAGWSFVKAGNVEGYIAANFLSAKLPVKPQVTGGLMPKYDDTYEYRVNYSGDEDYDFFYFKKLTTNRILITDRYDDEALFEYRLINNTMNITLAEDIQLIAPLPLSQGKTWSGTLDGLPVYYTVEYIDGWVNTKYMYYTDVVKISFKDSSGYVYGNFHLAPGYGVVWFNMNDIIELSLDDVF